MNFEAKPSKVVGKEGDTSFYVVIVLKNKYATIYIEYAEYIKDSARREVARSVAHELSG